MMKMSWNKDEILNPYKVNVVSFSGHGIEVEKDAIAVIP
jgi:IMP cyclohydrolase